MPRFLQMDPAGLQPVGRSTCTSPCMSWPGSPATDRWDGPVRSFWRVRKSVSSVQIARPGGFVGQQKAPVEAQANPNRPDLTFFCFPVLVHSEGPKRRSHCIFLVPLAGEQPVKDKPACARALHVAKLAMWMHEICSHHFETMVETIVLLVFTWRIIRNRSFLGGAKWGRVPLLKEATEKKEKRK